MSDKFPPAMQRPRLQEMADKCQISVSQLLRDECMDWKLNGKKGHVYAVPVGFQIMILGWRAKGWNLCRSDMAFASLTQDGDDEGGCILEPNA